MWLPRSRRLGAGYAEKAAHQTLGVSAFRDPSPASYYSTLLPSEVIYVGGDPQRIDTILPYVNNLAILGNTIIILKDLADPKRPSFLITSLKSHFFPTGYWCAYLYQARHPDPLDYHLRGTLTLAINPYQIPYWFTWRFLSRRLRASQATATNRKLRKPSGFLIDPPLSQIALPCGEVG